MTVIYKKPKNSKPHGYKNKSLPITYPDLKVACILDEFSYECFKYECTLIDFGPYDWEKKLNAKKPQLLLVESAWLGNGGKWNGKIMNLHGNKNNPLRKLVNWCNVNGIPTVFWNKEDPGHFDSFLSAAELFDYVFTTDSNCIEKYKEKLNHDRVYALPFAAQPRMHNPINNKMDKKGRVAFAGTWHGAHEDRKLNAEIILKPALKYDLVIYDRASNFNSSAFKFPHEYRRNVRNSVPYNEMVKLYKEYEVFLNINSVNDSPTMFSRRIFELLASGTNVISSYSIGISNLFPGIIPLSSTPEDTIRHLENLLENKLLRDKMSIKGLRSVLNSHTYRHRLEFLLEKINLEYEKYDEPHVTVITCTNRPQFINNVFDNFLNQMYRNKELFIVLNNNSMNKAEWLKKAEPYENIKIFTIDEKEPLGFCLNYAIEKSNSNYIAKFDDDDYYGENYLLDSMNAFKYTDADIVGKFTNYVYFEGLNILAIKRKDMENRYVDYISGPTILFKKDVFKKVQFSTNREVGSDTVFLDNCKKKGFKVYSTDRFNHIIYRRNSPDDHTWKISQQQYLKNVEIIMQTDNPKDFVTV